MAAKSSARGELYFIGEKDPLTNEDTVFVKIGIVRESDGRDTAYRVREHQTGNPRQLYAIEIIQSPIVERLETALHGKFAPSRLSGEWFIFSSEERNLAIEAAKSFAKQAMNFEEFLIRAEDLRNAESSGEIVTPSDELIDIHRLLIQSRSKIKECQALEKTMKTALKEASESGTDVTKVLTVQQKKGAEQFDEAAFKLAYPEMWAEFAEQKSSFRGSFLVTDPVASRPDAYALFPEFAELRTKIDHAISLVESNPDQLHKMFLELLTIQRPAEWERDLYEARIKSGCGEAQEILGVCKWKREKVQKEVLNKVALNDAYPKTYAQFVSVGDSTTSAVLSKDLGFQI